MAVASVSSTRSHAARPVALSSNSSASPPSPSARSGSGIGPQATVLSSPTPSSASSSAAPGVGSWTKVRSSNAASVSGSAGGADAPACCSSPAVTSVVAASGGPAGLGAAAGLGAVVGAGLVSSASTQLSSRLASTGGSSGASFPVGSVPRSMAFFTCLSTSSPKVPKSMGSCSDGTTTTSSSSSFTPARRPASRKWTRWWVAPSCSSDPAGSAAAPGAASAAGRASAPARMRWWTAEIWSIAGCFFVCGDADSWASEGELSCCFSVSNSSSCREPSWSRGFRREACSSLSIADFTVAVTS
mmetsp:Transcript_16056/g.40809  ORF Transcript_16056/g.40809 Transcript_16056/m.40809 type:complete len:301 (-) Transcript_16056:169-1071(-)